MRITVDYEEMVQLDLEEICGGGITKCILGTASFAGHGFLADVGVGMATFYGG